MNSKNIFFLLAMSLGIVILLSSCKTTRQSQQIALTKQTAVERVEMILNQETPYNTLSGNLRFSIKPGKDRGNTTTNAQLRIIKNEMIQLSLLIPFIGTEAARINISPEQIIIVDRINRVYLAESMQNLKKQFPFDFDFYSLQSLFANQLFIAGKQELTRNDYILFDYRENEFFATLSKKDSRGIIYDFTSDYSRRIQKTEIYNNTRDVNLNWDYSDFGRTSNNRLFPMKMNVTLTIPDDLITMNLNFTNVDIDTRFDLKADIPSKYTQIGMEQVIRIIQSF